MNARQSTFLSIVIASVAAACAGSARGQELPAGPTRAEVKALVLQARHNGELMPAGEVPAPSSVAKSIRSRSDVQAAVLQARAEGELMPAGERSTLDDPASEPVLAKRIDPKATVTAGR